MRTGDGLFEYGGGSPRVLPPDGADQMTSGSGSRSRSHLYRSVLLFCIMMFASGASSVLAMYVLGIPLGDDFDASKPDVLVSLIFCSIFGLSLSILFAVRWFGWSYLRFGPLTTRDLSFAFVAVPLALGCSFLWSIVLDTLTDPVEPQMFVQAVLDVDNLGVVIFASMS